MPLVEMTTHLYRYFPQLENRKIEVPAGSVAEVINAIDELAPGFANYVMTEQGEIRRHIKLSINDNIVIDRKTLKDRVPEKGTLYIFQALSGG